MRRFKAAEMVPAKSLALTFCLAASASAVHAVPYAELGDAGETTATAQSVPGLGSGAAAIDAIRGSLLTTSGTDRADLFAIALTAGQTFSATTTASSLDYNDFDTTLFLFSGAGLGLLASDDDGGPQSTLSGFTAASSGLYYLGIAGAGYNPISAGGSIFPSLLSGGQFGPTGPGGGQALTGWNSTTMEGDVYEIRVTVSSPTSPVMMVPEPTSAELMLAGLLAMGIPVLRRRAAVGDTRLTRLQTQT